MDDTLGLQISNRQPPKLSEEELGFYYFLKPGNLPEPITIDNIEFNIVHGVMDRPPLDALLDFMNSKFVPMVKREHKWPESVKKEFMEQMHRFMSVVTDLCYKSKGTTMLYIPNEDLSDPEMAAKDKDLV